MDNLYHMIDKVSYSKAIHKCNILKWSSSSLGHENSNGQSYNIGEIIGTIWYDSYSNFEKTVSDKLGLGNRFQKRPGCMKGNLCQGLFDRFHVRVRYFEKISRAGDQNFLPWNHCTFIAGCATKILNLPIPFSKVSSFLHSEFPFIHTLWAIKKLHMIWTISLTWWSVL